MIINGMRTCIPIGPYQEAKRMLNDNDRSIAENKKNQAEIARNLREMKEELDRGEATSGRIDELDSEIEATLARVNPEQAGVVALEIDNHLAVSGNIVSAAIPAQRTSQTVSELATSAFEGIKKGFKRCKGDIKEVVKGVVVVAGSAAAGAVVGLVAIETVGGAVGLGFAGAAVGGIAYGIYHCGKKCLCWTRNAAAPAAV